MKTLLAIATVLALTSAAFAATPLTDNQLDRVTAGVNNGTFDFAAWIARNLAIGAAACPGCTPSISTSTSTSP